MTSITTIFQPLFDFFGTVNAVYLVLYLGCGAMAAWNKQVFLYAITFVGLFALVFSRFATFIPTITEQLNTIFVFLIVGYCAATGLKLAFNYWRDY